MASKRLTIKEHAEELQKLKLSGKAPEDMDLEAYVTLYKNLYEYKDDYVETPDDLYRRVAKTAAAKLTKHSGIEEDFYYLISNNYLGLATPVAANLGTPASSLPISCYVVDVQDSVEGIFGGLFRAAMLTKGGGGVGVGLEQIRQQGSIIKGGGKSNGAKPWASIYDFASLVVSQAGVRRGQFAFYIDIESTDLWDLLLSKDHSKGDPRGHIHSNIAVNIRDSFMEKVYNGDAEAIARWNAVLRTRLMSGSPYLHFIDSANKDLVPWMKKAGKKVTGSNICTEITSCADAFHDMVCCLASLNLAKYDQWKNWKGKYGNVFQVSTFFLDAVMQCFIDDTADTKKYPGFEHARAYAIKGRPLGLGVFGYHAYLMRNNWAFKSEEARFFNEVFFGKMAEECNSASILLGNAYGSCEWGDGIRRNIQTTSIAPTVGNSVTNMGITPGIEPIAGNFYEAKGAVGSWQRVNPILKEYLQTINKDNDEVWDNILENGGSVQHLDFLPENIKEVFKTFVEIDQREIIYQAAQRQKYLEQTQSVNLSFVESEDADYINDVHLMAYEAGLHTLYYLRTNSAQRTAISEKSKEQKPLQTLNQYHVFTKPGCSWCEKAIDLLEVRGENYISYKKEDEFNSKFQSLLDSMNTFPKIIFVSHKSEYELVGGYNELAAKLFGESTVGQSQESCDSCSG